MKEGKIVLVDLLQSDGTYKLRPGLALKSIPKYNDCLVAGISTRLKQDLKGFDFVFEEDDPHFPATGLRSTSLIRLLYLAVVPGKQIAGSIGEVPGNVHVMLLQRLAKFLLS